MKRRRRGDHQYKKGAIKRMKKPKRMQVVKPERVRSWSSKILGSFVSAQGSSHAVCLLVASRKVGECLPKSLTSLECVL